MSDVAGRGRTFGGQKSPAVWVFLCEVACAPSHTCAEACLMGCPNAQPQGWDKSSVVQHHQARLTVFVKCRCCATSLFLLMDSTSPLACCLVRAHSRQRCV